MKVAMIARTIPPFDRGGIQRHVRDLSIALGRAGHEVHLFIEGRPITVAPGVRIHPIRPIPLPRLTAGEYVSLSLFAARQARRHPFDVFHVHSMYGFGHALSGGGPTVATLHGTQVNELHAAASSGGTLNHLLTDSVSVVMEGYVARRADVLIAVSRANRRDVVRQYGVPAGKVRVIPNGVWSSKHRPSDMARPDVVAVGRIHERKGFDLLVRAVARSPDALHGHRLTIVGSGEMEASLRALIRSEGVATRVRLAGHLPDDRLRDLLAHARLLVMPSRYEGFGMVMIEGMASGLPVLSTRAGAAPDVIEAGVNGFLVGPDDPTDRSREDEVVEGLSAGLADALSDIDRLRRMGVEARRTVEATYSWDRIAGMTVDVYREAIAARDGPGREGPAGGRR